MKKFVNKQTEITSQDEKGQILKMSFTDLALRTLDIVPQGGWTKDEMRMRFKLEDKLKGHGIDATVQLEDAEMAKLKALSDIPWKIKHRDVIDYMDTLEEAMKEK